MDPARYRPISVPLPDVPGRALGGGEWEGDGYPLLAVPGLGSNHRVWELLARVAPDHRILSVDARGRASGFGIPSPNGITTHADDLVRVLDTAGIDKAVVVGHSMGGFVTLRFAQRHPDRVAGLLMLDGGPPVKMPGLLSSPRAIRFAFNRSLPKSRPYASLAEYWAKATKRSATYETFDDAFVEWAFSIDLAGPPGALIPQQDRELLLTDAIECFTAPWRAEALRTLSVPATLLLAEFGASHKKKPLYRQVPAADALSPTTRVERLSGTDHVEVVWDPRTVAAITALVPAGDERR
jgi:pimeloyl-ACP methyl ester carboxylesterase